MGRIVKIIAWVVGGFVAAFALAALALYLFFDPNDFREDISAAVKERTGRDLVIDGDIALSLFPWLAVEVGKVSLGDAPGFSEEPIVAFDSASFSVRLLPALLSQEVVVGAADVEGLMLNLKVDGTGRTNWSELVPEDETGDAGEATSGRDVDINRIDLTTATITYTNAESDERIVLNDVNLSIGRLRSDGSAVPFDGSLRFDVHPAGLSGDLTIDTTLAYDAQTAIAVLEGLSIGGTVEGVASIPTKLAVVTKEVRVDTGASEVTMQPVEMEMLGMDIDAEVEPFTYDDRITPKAAVAIDAFSPRSLMQLFGVEAPVTADPNALSRVIVDATAQLTTNAIEMTDVDIKFDDTTFTGALAVPRDTSGTYRFDLTGDSIDVARYMAPGNEASGGGGADTVPVEIPVDLIKALNTRGTLKFREATLGQIRFENVELGLNAGNDRLRLYPISSQLFGGTYKGDVRVDASGSLPAISVNEAIAGVDMANLAQAMFQQDNVTGTIDGSFRLTGRGKDTAAMQRSLNGTMGFELSDGAFEGTDIWYELRRARARLKGEPVPEPTLPARTRFSTVRATGKVANGVLRNDDLFAELPFMQLSGKGNVDLAAATLDYSLTARFLERPEFATEATPEELEDFTEAVIPLKISGPLASPSVAPDIEKMLRDRVREELEDKVKDKLKDKLGELFGG